MTGKFYSLTFILAFLFLPVIFHGQSTDEASNKGFSLGIKAGIDISTWSKTIIPDGLKKTSKLGFQGGFVGRIGFNSFLALQFELLFAQKGYKVIVPNQEDENGKEITAKSWYTVNYLEIPILANFSYPLGPVVIFGNLGPYVGIGLSASTVTTPDAGKNAKIPFGTGGVKRFDFGLIFGGGVSYGIWKGDLFLDLRYGLGLTDINSVPSSMKEESDYIKNANRNFGISIGYLIRLGK